MHWQSQAIVWLHVLYLFVVPRSTDVTAAARVQSQVRSYGICGGQSVTGADFLSSTSVSSVSSHSTNYLIFINHPAVNTV
jgi:hypothetical protein